MIQIIILCKLLSCVKTRALPPYITPNYHYPSPMPWFWHFMPHLTPISTHFYSKYWPHQQRLKFPKIQYATRSYKDVGLTPPCYTFIWCYNIYAHSHVNCHRHLSPHYHPALHLRHPGAPPLRKPLTSKLAAECKHWGIEWDQSHPPK